MSMLLNPFIYVLDKMNFGKRFLMICLLIFVTLFTISYLYVKNEINQRLFLVSEMQPVKYYEPVTELMKRLAMSRMYHMLASKGNVDAGLRDKINDADTRVEQAISAIKNTSEHAWSNDKNKQNIAELESKWTRLKSELTQTYTETLMVKHQEIADHVANLMESIEEQSSISLDTDPTTSLLVSVFLLNAPQAAEQAINLREMGAEVLVQKQATPALRERINYFMALSDAYNQNLTAAISTLGELDSNYTKLFANQSEMIEKDTISALVTRDILKPTAYAMTVNEYNNEMTSYISGYFALSDLAYKAFQDRYQVRIRAIDKHISIAVFGLMGIFVLICLIFLAFYRSTDTAVRVLIDNANAIAEGDLTRKITADRSDEFGLLMKALSNMQSKISDIVQQIKNTSNVVGRGAIEISQGNLDLSKRTEQQASSLASTAASMEELSVTVKENARQSKKAAELAEHAQQQADSSGQVVNHAVEAMTQINASSKKIAEISGVIDEIAFQTNLLALNAAIEAARAGDQGRGFAVVAQEVRNLAQRSSTAAKEINALISDSVEKISTGADLVTKSGEALHEIVKSAATVSELVGSIATATSQQAQGLEEINKAITQMDGITQQNAALVEQTAAASENVNQQVKGLIQQIEFFKDNKVAQEFVISNPATFNLSPASVQSEIKMAAAQQGAAMPSMAKPERRGHSDQDWTEF